MHTREGVVLSLTAIVASLLIGELHRTPRLLISNPVWYGIVVNALRSASFGSFVSALVSALAVCSVATYAPTLDRDVASPLTWMVCGMVLYVLQRCLFLPVDTMGGFSTHNITKEDRQRATIAITVPEYCMYVILLAYITRLTLRARDRQSRDVRGVPGLTHSDTG